MYAYAHVRMCASMRVCMCCISYKLTKTQVITLTNHVFIKQFFSYQIIRPKCYIEKTTIHSIVSVSEVP